MGNITIFETGELAEDYVLPEQGLSELAKSIAQPSGGTNRRIQTNTNGTFRRVVNGQQIGNAIRGEFSAIIVGMLPKVSRQFYASSYDPTAKATLPDCWSNLGNVPEEGAPNKQASNCAVCPQNVAGSGNGGKGRACKFQRRVALILPGRGAEVYQFNIPATSLYGEGAHNVHPFESYVRFLIANNTSIDYVVTKIAYDLDADTMKLKFSPIRPITKEELEFVKAAQGDPACQRAIQLTVAQTDGAKQIAESKPEPESIFEEPEAPQVVKTPQAEADDAWGDDVQDAEYEEVAPKTEAPKKRKTEKAKVEPKADLQNIIDAWAEDD